MNKPESQIRLPEILDFRTSEIPLEEEQLREARQIFDSIFDDYSINRGHNKLRGMISPENNIFSLSLEDRSSKDIEPKARNQAKASNDESYLKMISLKIFDAEAGERSIWNYHLCSDDSIKRQDFGGFESEKQAEYPEGNDALNLLRPVSAQELLDLRDFIAKTFYRIYSKD